MCFDRLVWPGEGWSGPPPSGAQVCGLPARTLLLLCSARPGNLVFQHWLIYFRSSNLNWMVVFALLYFSGINYVFLICVDILVLLLFFYLNWLVLFIFNWTDCLIFLCFIDLIDWFCLKSLSKSKKFCMQSSWYFGKIASEDIFSLSHSSLVT